MATEVTGNKHSKGSLGDLLLTVKKNIFRTLETCDLATIESISGSTYYCKIIGTELTISTSTFYLGLEISVGDVVMIQYTSLDFRNNLTRIKNNQATQEESGDTRHNNAYGIITGIIYKGE